MNYFWSAEVRLPEVPLFFNFFLYYSSIKDPSRGLRGLGCCSRWTINHPALKGSAKAIWVVIKVIIRRYFYPPKGAVYNNI